MPGFLRDCRKIETLVSQVYQHFAAQSDYPERIRQLFRQLASDEEEHARQFDLALQLPAGTIGSVRRIAGEKVTRGVDMAQTLLQDLQYHRCDVEKALKVALRLEEEFVRIHLDNSVLMSDERISAVFTNLARGDEEHLATLRETIVWWKGQQGQPTTPGAI